jgi:DNA-binding FrmR family transcriptional regulator
VQKEEQERKREQKGKPSNSSLVSSSSGFSHPRDVPPETLRDRESARVVEGGHKASLNNHERHHVHNAESQRRILNRLSRIEGHVRGIKTMVQNDTYCPEVLIQIAAVRGALDRVARLILDEHLNECVTRAAKAGDIEAELKELKEILDRFLP